jgi:hypothetical protein
MEVYGSPTVVRQKYAERFAGRDNLSVNIILTNPVCYWYSEVKRGMPYQCFK